MYGILVATESTCDIYAPDDDTNAARRIAGLTSVVGAENVVRRELADIGELRVHVMEAKFKRIRPRYHAGTGDVADRCETCGRPIPE
jgi:hypothetical protein